MFFTFLKKTCLVLLVLVLILTIGGMGGILFDRYFVPRMANLRWFANTDFFKKATEHVTIINKTEQVVVREDDSVERIVSQPATAVVNIVVLPGATTSVKGNEEALGAAASQIETTTGVLLTNDGLVVTYSQNAPLSDSQARYSILLFDGSSHAATFIGRDTLTNLNFFRLDDATNTPAIALANSDDARVGKKLIAIGNTFAEYQNRLSVGILNNINRIFNLSGKTVASSEKWEGIFEMDLNVPENFIGGPVVGFNGEMVGLVGVVTLDNVAHPFLIPANVVRDSLNRAMNNTLRERPTLGIYYLPITKALALGYGLARDRGALIYSPSGKTGLAILSDSPALKAGLQVGDIIAAVNGGEINLDNPLPKALSSFNKGDRIELLIIRSGQEKKVMVNL